MAIRGPGPTTSEDNGRECNICKERINLVTLNGYTDGTLSTFGMVICDNCAAVIRYIAEHPPPLRG